MFYNSPKHKHSCFAIYRGAGGAGDAVNDSSSEASAAVLAAASAEAAKIAAEAARDAAQLAETNAESAETNAETAETNAETAASNALTSANNASNSAVSASNSATSASSSATSAGVSATNAANSSTAAAGSASAAAISATSASNSASSATASASSATSSATAAATSASSASSSASTATTQASNASTSATNAASSASTANSAATTATTQAGIATTQATNASNSASAAATSATNAANSASTATTQAGIATTQATNAATSATDSATSATASAAARDAALAALDSFDDRYLGTKSSDPTLDNDGNALVSGALYFNTVSNSMKVYDGSLWLAAYASLSGALLSANNLSDLNNVATARTNLGLGTAATTSSTDYATAAQGTNADTAYADRMKWDGGSTGLVAATGRTSLGLGSIATLAAPVGTVVGTSDTQTLTNKTISGSTNTLSNISNSSLTNSAITINGVSTSLGGSASVGTVTSVSGTAPINVATGTSTPAISINQATTSTSGYLSSTDWNTFNNKQTALVSGTNIKTVNGSTLLGAGNLAVGTVTSVGASVPVGLTVSGSPITGSGTLAITYTAGYAIPTTASQTNWDSAYTQRLQWDGGATNLVAATGRTSLGGTTVGSNFFTLANPTAVTFPRINADNTVSALARQDAIDALAGSTTSGQYLRGNGTDVVMSAIQAADVPTLNQSTTGSAATLTTGRTLAITGDLAWTSPSFNGSTNVTAAGTLATVNANVGSFGSATSIPVVTVNAKGLVTAVSTATVAGGQYFGTAATKAISYNANSISENITVTAGNNGLSAGPITINTGFTVTVQTGANWVIV